MTAAGDEHVEPGGTFGTFWRVAAFLAALVLADVLLPGPDVPPGVWIVAIVAVLGIVAAGAVTARRIWTVRVGGRGSDAALSVGRERIPLSDVDGEHLRAVRAGTAGVDAGAPVLGGGATLPPGRTGLPLRLTDGRTVLVPTRNPAALTRALLGEPATGASDAPTGNDAPRRSPAGGTSPEGASPDWRTLEP